MISDFVVTSWLSIEAIEAIFEHIFRSFDFLGFFLVVGFREQFLFFNFLENFDIFDFLTLFGIF